MATKLTHGGSTPGPAAAAFEVIVKVLQLGVRLACPPYFAFDRTLAPSPRMARMGRKGFPLRFTRLASRISPRSRFSCMRFLIECNRGR